MDGWMDGWMAGWKGDEFPTKFHGDVRLCKGFWLTDFSEISDHKQSHPELHN